MIRIIKKPLLKEWTTAQAFKPVANHPHSFPGHGRTVITLTASELRIPSLSSLRAAGIGRTRYSTIPNQAKVKTKAEAPPPSPSSTFRKPKVDLRPAPKKPGQDVRGHTQPSRSPPSAIQVNTTSSSTTSTQPPVSTKPNVVSPGPLEATKYDIAEATKHGILSPPPEGASRVGKLWHQFKQLFWFYWDGLKLIFVTHRRQATAIQKRAAEARKRGEEAGLTRWETRFLRTYKRDLVKLVPFILTLMVLEEALPFIVLYAPGMLPSTCLLPSQRQRIEAKRRAKQMAHMASVKSLDSISSPIEKGVKSLNPDLTPTVAGIFSRATWGPLFLQRRRIAKHLAYLSSDDTLLAKEGSGSRLKDDELVEALEERGFITDAQTPQQMREKLQRWLKGAKDDSTRLRLVIKEAVGELGAK